MASESDSPQPIAWVAFAADGSESAVAVMHRDEADEIAARHGWAVAPLYRSPTLTDAEREAIRFAAVLYEMGDRAEDAATLRGLLERTR
jgi:hypothetical protein